MELLVIKPSSFGDILHGLQVVESLREQRGGAPRVTWVARDVFAPLVVASETVDEVLIYERHGGPGRFLALLKTIRQRRFDAALDLQGLARSGLMTLAARAPLKIGRSDAREGSRLCYRQRMPLPPAGREAHAVDILLQALPLLGGRAEVTRALRFRPPERPPESFDPAVLRAGGGAVTLFPESRRPEKEWGGFGDLTDALLASAGGPVVVWAGSRHREGPATPPPGRFLNLLGKTAMDDLVPLVSASRLVVANDSGPMHLAAALGVPVLALFGPTSPARYGPYPLDRPTNRVLQAPGGDLGQLEVEAVAAAAREMLG